jgi:ABC-type Fe3+/spermidine/putrescine transport system ATPase subunit
MVGADTSALQSGERCHAVVRPEKLQIEPLEVGMASSANGLPQVEGTVESSLYLGTATQIVVDLGEGVRMTVLCPNASESERQRLPGGGARVALSWDPEHMHVVRESASPKMDSNRQESEHTERGELEAAREGE